MDIKKVAINPISNCEWFYFIYHFPIERHFAKIRR